MMRPLQLFLTLLISSAMTGAASAQVLNLATQAAPSEDNTPNLVSQNPDSNSELSALEQEIIEEMNRVRRDPAAYAQELAQMKQYYQGNLLTLPGRTPIVTKEGVQALDDAIEFLNSADSLPPFRTSMGMSMAARDHVQDQGAAGATGHQGNDGSTLTERINRYGTGDGYFAEGIEYGSNTAQDVVRNLVIDDGVVSRGHRKQIFEPIYKFTGVACGNHANYDNMCVITYAREYTDNRNLAQTVETTPSETETPTEENANQPDNSGEVTQEANPNNESPTTPPETETPAEENANQPDNSGEVTQEANPNEQAVPENNITINTAEIATVLPFLEQGALEEGDNKLPADNSFYDIHAFSGTAGQSITIAVESEDFDTYLFLLDPANEQIAENDDLAEGNSNSTITLTLPSDGIYKVIVNSYDEDGKGSYDLSVRE